MTTDCLPDRSCQFTVSPAAGFGCSTGGLSTFEYRPAMALGVLKSAAGSGVRG
jgi:hypothetical protein